MAPHEAHVSFAIAKVGSFSETTKFLPCFLVCFAFFGAHFILSTWFCDEKALQSDPDGIQTHDLQNRNLTLYSAKLRSLVSCKNTAFLRLDQTILSFHPFALQWFWRFRPCACNTYDLPTIRSKLPTKKLPRFPKNLPRFSENLLRFLENLPHFLPNIGDKFKFNQPLFLHAPCWCDNNRQQPPIEICK